MKTLIIGTGVIGTIYGWALSESGVDITHLVRKACFEPDEKKNMIHWLWLHHAIIAGQVGSILYFLGM